MHVPWTIDGTGIHVLTLSLTVCLSVCLPLPVCGVCVCVNSHYYFAYYAIKESKSGVLGLNKG